MFRQQMTRLFAINSRSRHWLVWIALLVPFAAAAFASIPHLTNAKYGDYTYATDGLTLTNGNNSYTVIATDSSIRKDTNVITANLPSSVSFTYDSNGNLTSDGLRGFDYDDENRLTGITVTHSWKTLLIYDGLGRRRGRYEYLWFNGAWAWNLQVEYVYDGNVVVQERWGGDEPWVNYTRGLDVSGTWQGAGGVGGLLAWSQKISGAYQSHYYHADGNGNVTAMLNTNQVVSARYLYDPYGNLLASSGGMADVNVYRFSSQEFHEKSGLYAYAMRFYEPRLGRWLNGDPLREGGGVNLYQAMGNDAINRVDAWGLTDFIYGPMDAALLVDPEFRKGFNQGLVVGTAVIAGVGGVIAGGVVYGPTLLGTVLANQATTTTLTVIVAETGAAIATGSHGPSPIQVPTAAANTVRTIVTGSRAMKSVKAAKSTAQKIALGKSIGLDEFAASQGARNLMKDPNFLNTIASELRAGTKFSVDLSGIGGEVGPAIQRAASGRGTPFDMELLEIRNFIKEIGAAEQIEFFLSGAKTGNPF